MSIVFQYDMWRKREQDRKELFYGGGRGKDRRERRRGRGGEGVKMSATMVGRRQKI